MKCPLVFNSVQVLFGEVIFIIFFLTSTCFFFVCIQFMHITYSNCQWLQLLLMLMRLLWIAPFFSLLRRLFVVRGISSGNSKIAQIYVCFASHGIEHRNWCDVEIIIWMALMHHGYSLGICLDKSRSLLWISNFLQFCACCCLSDFIWIRSIVVWICHNNSNRIFMS